VERHVSLLIGKAYRRFRAVTGFVEEREGLHVGQSLAVSKKVIHVRIGRPAIAVPDFQDLTALSGHPSSYQEAADLIEVR
jgi:hypothetical protein